MQGQISLLVNNLVDMFAGDEISPVEKKYREERDKDGDYDKQFQANAFHVCPFIYA